MRCLVTGCNGFVGKYLSDFIIKRGLDVYGIDNLLANDSGNTFKVDITDRKQTLSIVKKIKPDIRSPLF